MSVVISKRLTDSEKVDLEAFILRDRYNWDGHNKELLSKTKACNGCMHIKGF